MRLDGIVEEQRAEWRREAERLGIADDVGWLLDRYSTRRSIRSWAVHCMWGASDEKLDALREFRALVGGRDDHATRCRKWRARRREQRAASDERTCSACGTSLQGRRADAITCSARCRMVMSRFNALSKRAAASAALAEEAKQKHERVIAELRQRELEARQRYE